MPLTLTFQVDRPGIHIDQYGPPYEQTSFHTVPASLTNHFLSKFLSIMGVTEHNIYPTIRDLRETYSRVNEVSMFYRTQITRVLISNIAFDNMQFLFLSPLAGLEPI